MKEFQQKTTNCKKINSSHNWLEKRLVFEKPQEQLPDFAHEATADMKKAEIVDLNKYEGKATFTPNLKKTLETLAKSNKILAGNFEKALEESLNKAGYSKDLKGFWEEMDTLNCKKITVDKGQIYFWDAKEKNIAPRFTAIPIETDFEVPDKMRTHLELNKQNYVVLTEIQTKSSYSDIAKAILEYETGKGALIDGKKVLDDETCARIIRTNISIPEYAALLKSGHESIGKHNSLPILLPLTNLERVNDIHSSKTKAEAEKHSAKVAAENEKQLQDSRIAGLKVINLVRDPAEKKEIANYLAEYQTKITAEKKPAKKAELLAELLTNLDDFYKEAGITRSINKNTLAATAGGKDNAAWRELWIKENASVDNLMKLLGTIPDNPQLASLDKNTVRGTIFDLIEAGSSKTFTSGDIISHLKIKTPDGNSYDAILGLAAAPNATEPYMQRVQNRYRNFVAAIEGLGDAIEGLDPGKASELKLSKAGRLRVNESVEVSNEIPGVPTKDLLEISKEKGEKLINNNLAKKVKAILNTLGVMDTAKFVNTPENLSKLRDNDQTWINIRYLNRDFTLHINNATVGWGVRVKPGFNQDAQNGETAYTTAGGMNIEEAVKGINKAISYQKYETADKGPESSNSKYDASLRKIFAFGLVDSNEKGRNIDMADTNTNGTTLSQYSKDEYFTKTSGTAAYNDFYDQVRTRDEKGQEVIDIKKANEKLESAYIKGKVKLQELARSGNSYYIELERQSNELAKISTHKTIDLNFPVTALEQKIIRLGYLAESEQKEKDQTKSLDKFKEQLVENILKLLPETVTGPDGQVINKDQMRTTLKEFPVGVLLTHSYNADKSHSVGVNLPIILDVFNSDQAKMVIIPGVGNEGLRLAVGLSFTSKDPAKDQNVIFFGGVSVGASTTGSLGPAIGGGADFRISKADEISNYNQYLGIQAGLGMDITKGQAGLNIGPTYTWGIDAKKKYENNFREALEKEGLKNLLEELKNTYKKGSNPYDIGTFVNKVSTNTKLADKLGININTSSEKVLLAFEQYLGEFKSNFDAHFNLPPVTAGKISLSVVDGAIIGTGLATADAPLVLGGVAKWGIQVMAGLKFNIGSKMVIERERKTSEREMNLFADKQKQDQFDEQFSNLPKSAQSSKLYLSGPNTLDVAGNKQTSRGEEIKVTTESTELQADNLGKQLDKFNKSLLEKGIDLKLQKNPDNSIEIVLLNTKVNANEKFLISPDLAIRTGDRLFLRNPNNLKYLYFDKQSRIYPLETSHGATIESITTISDNRFHSGKSFPTEISITRFADQKNQPYIEGKTGVAEKYVDNSIDYKAIAESQKKMGKALDKSTGIESEKIRPDMKKIAKDIFKYKTATNETFINLTNIKAKGNETNPDNESQNLYSFYDKYTTEKKIKPFNAAEKDILTLELSTLRYTDLQAGAQSKAEKLSRFEKRLDWAKGTLQPYFEKRLEELSKSGQIQLAPGEIKQRATLLVNKAVNDLKYSFYNPITQLEKGTSVSVAIGVRTDLPGGRVGPKVSKGLHQMLDGSREGLQTNEVDEYGYMFGKDYTDALQSGTPKEDHDIALILMGQLSNLPEKSKIKEFMDSSLARKLASNGGLAFILGQANYEKVIQHYEKGTGNQADLTPFMDIVEKIRTAEQNGQKLISVAGDKGVSFQIRINTKIQSGVFQKCANYSSTINEEIVILPPDEVAAMNLLAGAGETRTTLNAKTYKQFLTFFGGVSSTVSLDVPGAAVEKPKQVAGEKGETKVDSGNRESDMNSTPERTAPVDAPAGAPTPTGADQGGGEAL